MRPPLLRGIGKSDLLEAAVEVADCFAGGVSSRVAKAQDRQ